MLESETEFSQLAWPMEEVAAGVSPHPALLVFLLAYKVLDSEV